MQDNKTTQGVSYTDTTKKALANTKVSMQQQHVYEMNCRP